MPAEAAVLELRGLHGLEEGKRQGRLASSGQYGNAPLLSLPMKKKKEYLHVALA